MNQRIFRQEYLSGNDAKFEPFQELEDKQNVGRHWFIERDGRTTQVVRLNVLKDRHREDIIGFHFAQQYAEIHYGEQLEQPQFYVVGRDEPWDFEYVMHDGTTFFVEICRIADKDLLKAMKIENDVTSLLLKPKIKGFEIEKVEKHFPGTLPTELTSQIKCKADRRREFSLDGIDAVPGIFLRPPMNPKIDLVRTIEVGLRKKAAKKHAGKERTIIVLDNLTTHSDPSDFFSAFDELSEFIDALKFPSIWLYTGFYSDNDGYNCEYSLIPIKIPEKEWRQMQVKYQESKS